MMSGVLLRKVHPTSLFLTEDGRDLFDHPMQICGGDDEGRREADDALVRFFAQDAAGQQLLTIRPRRSIQLDPDEQPAPTNIHDDATAAQ